MSNKIRLDQLLVERGLADSRTKAQALIMAGQVRADGKILTKPGVLLNTNSELQVIEGLRYVSRGGLKLESVSGELGLDFSGKTVVDVGASTGGFTDYALQNGAVKVYAVDVGKAQLDPKLRHDSRVVVMEQTDVRRTGLPEKVDLALIDVSFISLTKVLPRITELIKPSGYIVAMAKPQFEADKPTADRYKGVIKDPEVRSKILADLEQHLKLNFEVIESADSGQAGAKGNLERFYLLRPKS